MASMKLIVRTEELMMSTRKMIIGLCICLFLIVFAGQTLSQTQRDERAGKRTDMSDWASRETEQWQKMHERRMQQWQRQREQR
jgi:hypothetical protein